MFQYTKISKRQDSTVIYKIFIDISEQPDLERLPPEEIGILNIIVDKFKDMSSVKISAMSRKEDAWKEYHDCDDLISYNEAHSN